MTDSLEVYGTLLAAFCEYIPRSIFGDVRRLMGLAWAVVGLCLSETVNFNKWGEVVISEAQYASSHQRRFQSWLYNPRVKPVKFYFPLLKAALSEWSLDQTLYLALDVSDLKNGYILIRQNKWGYRIRAKSSTKIRLPDRSVTNFAQLCPPKGQAHFYHQVHILDENIGPLYIALANPEDNEEPWYIISDEPTSVTPLDDYARRLDIEEGFLDDKSGGFQVESTRLDDPKAIARLFLVLAVATLHFTSVGVAVVNRQARRWVDTHWDRGMSYLKIGWRWLRQQFRKNWPVLPPFRLDPKPDPQPAIASRRKVAEPKRQGVVSCFGTF